MKGWYQVFLFPHIHFAVVSFCYTELLVVWGKYDFTKKHFWWLEESVTWSFPLLSLMPCPAGLFFFQFLQQLLLPACLPNPLRRLWAAEPCPGRGRACMTAHMAVGCSASPEQALKLDLVGKIFTDDANIQPFFFPGWEHNILECFLGFWRLASGCWTIKEMAQFTPWENIFCVHCKSTLPNHGTRPAECVQ